MSDVSLSVSLCSRNSTFDFSSWQQRELSLTFEKTSEMSLILCFFPGGLEPKKLTYIKSKTRTTTSQQKEQTRLQLANCKTQWNRFIWHIWENRRMFITFITLLFSVTKFLSHLDAKKKILKLFSDCHFRKWPHWMAWILWLHTKFIHECVIAPLK